MKRCIDCGIEISSSSHSARCSDCIDVHRKLWRKQYHLSIDRTQYSREYYQKNKEEILKRTSEYSKNNREKYREWNATWLSKNKDKRNKSIREKRRGVTEARYFEMLTEQNNQCAICGKPFTCVSEFALDHNHDNGKIRGVLCKHCNSAIGLLGDNANTVYSAANYLREQNAPV